MESLKTGLTIVGFGSQAKAWALNLLDSKQNVSIALKKSSKSKELAQKMGFNVIELETSALSSSNIFVMLIPRSTPELSGKKSPIHSIRLTSYLCPWI